MCPPEHFAVSYSINPWMDTQVRVDPDRARAQWDGLVRVLEQAGATVERLPATPGLPDQVFTANAGIVDGTTFLPARMRHPERQPEREQARAWFAARGYRIAELGPTVVQEGSGDALPMNGTLVTGYRTRSSAAASVDLARLVTAPILPVELVDPRYYHVDLTLCPLDERRALVFPDAWDADGRARLADLVPEPLVLEPEEAAQFVANAVVVGRTVVLPACPPRVGRRLESWGFEVAVADVGEFRKAGGAVRCLTLALDAELSAASAPAGAASSREAITLVEEHSAHNYHPLPVVVAQAEGAWVTDVEGRRYLDALAAYSALNFGHRHPDLVAAARAQLDRVTLTSRAFHNDQLGPFCAELAELCGKDAVLPMNTGAEAVETAIKTARKWGYERRGVPDGRARIVVCEGNFHGRTTTIVGFSDDPGARGGFGPFTPGFTTVPYGSVDALRDAVDDDTVAFLFEPVQGEAGVVVPPDGYLLAVRRLCSERGVLMVADEIQSGLGRTGRTFACDHEGVVPDVYVLGKALGGGIVPLSAVVADEEILGVFRPGEHGSTFGGNPLACAVGRAVLRLLRTGEYQERAARLGRRLADGLAAASLPAVKEVRARGLWLGVELAGGAPPARELCERLARRGLLCKDTHETTIRLAPPLVLSEEEADWALERLLGVLSAA
jgi:ornithine--oxo-acid transaminase